MVQTFDIGLQRSLGIRKICGKDSIPFDHKNLRFKIDPNVNLSVFTKQKKKSTKYIITKFVINRVKSLEKNSLCLFCIKHSRIFETGV